ncbi:MAG: DEAD/DEAH box helicase [Anaerolineae bacterium]
MNLILHGTWSQGAFFLWAESSTAAPRRRGRQPRLPHHPQAAPAGALRAALAALAPLGDWSLYPEDGRLALLPSTPGGPALPPWLADEPAIAETAEEEAPILRPWRVPGLGLDLLAALDLLATLSPSGRARRPWGGNATDSSGASEDGSNASEDGSGASKDGPYMGKDGSYVGEDGWDAGWIEIGADLAFWGLAAKMGLELLAGQRYLPGIEPETTSPGEDTGHYRAAWLPALDRPQDRVRLRTLAGAMPPVCRGLFAIPSGGAAAAAGPDPASAPAPYVLLDDFLRVLVNRAVRDWGRPHLDRRRHTPGGVAGAWWSALWSPKRRIEVPPRERRTLAALYEAWRDWTGQLRGEAEAAFRLCFRLEPPEVDEETGRVLSPDWTLRYLLQASDDPSLLVPAEQVWSARGGTLRVLNRRFEGAQERLLAGLGLAGRLFPPIVPSLHTARPVACSLSVDEAYAFLREVGPLLEGSGFGVLVPPWWDKPGARLGVRATLKAEANIIGSGILNLDSLVEFDWELALGDEALTREEFERLAALKMPLVQIRGQWVMLQADQVEAAIAFWERKRRQAGMSLREALALSLGAADEVEGLPLHGVEAEGWLDDLLQQLQAGEALNVLPPPDGLRGELRPYQVRGYSWLAFLRRWGLGACLADDMGLGKTVQAIALLLRERQGALSAGGNGAAETGAGAPALVICPTSVVGNWKREIQRFAPDLRVLVHHGSERASGDEFLDAADEHDVVISTYGLARRDVDDLEQVRWSDVILDEAQNIKNPHTKQAQAVRRLPADNRIALTGTPVENRLSELWSIMQFLNPGYLGSQTRFRKDLALPIERYGDLEATERLRGLVSPFVLRRVKTDPTIIHDLPDKLEMKVYCNLTSEQATLYEAVVQESLERIGSSEEGIERRGVVLGALTRLKQVCNHPAQFLGDGSALAGRSGKLERLGEMLEEALSVGDRALIFTQYAQMGHMLRAYLQGTFGVEVLFLHGGTPQKQRDRMVARFQAGGQGPPLFILSLKAGGTGLNLTAANHVFHYDRWWNPAVEDQATDRAFRIGQTRDVQVHKFLCAGTLEERIDELIESKKALAESVVSAGEGWLTELTTDELRDLMVLRTE